MPRKQHRGGAHAKTSRVEDFKGVALQGARPFRWLGGVGVATDGSLFEIFVSDKGTWSLLITNGKKISCIVAAGDMCVPYPALGAEARMQ